MSATPSRSRPLETPGGPGFTAPICVPDVVVVMARAMAEGAQVMMSVADPFGGNHSGVMIDPFGHRWMIGTRRRQVTTPRTGRGCTVSGGAWKSSAVAKARARLDAASTRVRA